MNPLLVTCGETSACSFPGGGFSKRWRRVKGKETRVLLVGEGLNTKSWLCPRHVERQTSSGFGLLGGCYVTFSFGLFRLDF